MVNWECICDSGSPGLCAAAKTVSESAKRGGPAHFCPWPRSHSAQGGSSQPVSVFRLLNQQKTITATKTERLFTRSAKWIQPLYSSVLLDPTLVKGKMTGWDSLLLLKVSCLQIDYRLTITWNYMKHLVQDHREDLQHSRELNQVFKVQASVQSRAPALFSLWELNRDPNQFTWSILLLTLSTVEGTHPIAAQMPLPGTRHG